MIQTQHHSVCSLQISELGRPVIALITLSVLITAIVPAQHHSSPSTPILLDTSFTLYSAWKSVAAKYPVASLVTPDELQNVVATENIVYASLDQRQLHLDLFRPPDSSRIIRPAVLLIHGGGWRSGNRQMEWPMARYLAGKGYVTATVEYRLSPEAAYPAAVHDIKAAIRWMKRHARQYNIDEKRIALYGCSAGGQLAALVGVTPGIPRFDGEEGDTTYPTSVQAIVDIDGILDFTDPAESGKDTGSAPPSTGKRWLGSSFRDRPDLWKDASPMNYVNKKTPPIVFINSAIDRFHAGRDEMREKMKKYDIYSEVHTIPGTPHTFWLFHPWFEETCGYVRSFLDNTLKMKDQKSKR